MSSNNKEYAILFYRIKTPLKQTHNLKIVDFEVTIVDSLEKAQILAYYLYNLSYRPVNVHHMMFNVAPYSFSEFEVAFFTEHQGGKTYAANRESTAMKNAMWQAYQTAHNYQLRKDVSLEMSAKLPEFLLPEGYEFATSGILDDTFQVFNKASLPKNRCFVNVPANMMGQDIDKTTLVFYISIEQDDGSLKTITRRDRIFAKPKTDGIQDH